jgi:hypothetical protein
MGKLMDDDDLISFIISGLNPAHNSFVTIFSFAIQTIAISFSDFQTELLSHEILLQSQNHHAIAPETVSFALYSNHPKLSNS